MRLKERILVIDDEKEVLRLLSLALREESYDVTTAADSSEGIYLFKLYQPDLVILDIKMPKLDGFQVLDLIRECSNVPIIMLTGILDKATLYDAITLGADDFVTKPFSTQELLARIRAKLRRAKSITISNN